MSDDNFDVRLSIEQFKLMMDGHPVRVFVVDEAARENFPNFRDKANFVGKAEGAFIVAASSAATVEDCERVVEELLAAMDFKFDAEDELHRFLRRDYAEQIHSCALRYGGCDL